MRKYMQPRSIRILTAVLVTVILLDTGISVSFADTQPPILPNRLYGTVKLISSSGQINAPEGTLVEALIDNTVKGSTTVIADGMYYIDVIGANDDGGKDITFRVDGIVADQKSVYNTSMPDPRPIDLAVDVLISDTNGDSGGGGGGGGASGEDYANIEVKEKYELYIYKDKITSYAFTNRSNPILFVNITGNISAGEISTTVEVLRNTSSLLNISAPGTVYKNINIWVGSYGFAVPENIKDAAIKFRVGNSWLSSNNLASEDLRLVKWDGNKWIQLETVELMRDDTYTYYEARTNSFSPFAITGIITAVSPEMTKVAETVEAVETATAGAIQSEEAPPTNIAMIIGVIILIAVIAAVYIKRKNRLKR